MNSWMGKKVGDQGIIRWAVFDLTTFRHAAARSVSDITAPK
jgi:hypothetical protein